MFEKERAEIDAIDQELVRLFERRMDAVTEIARIKKAHKLPILDQSREDRVLDKVRGLTENKAYEDSMEDLFRSLMTITKAFETKQNEE
ncbi:chorismate mutase [Trichococcus pasteurii]|uniref:Chorismate mutase type ii n=1 Tax=Trichococcus pasteurii TaxID=43064 RepID=A0A1W1IEI8_9LACT|nr:chorismate mutase [Trichococcus pasteurii]SFE12433.1 chorismate mutase [Trichococcus pasteurii]SLM51412.1 chorismate mutase type ii [Trichococcus pasteurii]SSB92293.1 chorismate mutase type ii [Trichococcus pasteurii]